MRRTAGVEVHVDPDRRVIGQMAYAAPFEVFVAVRLGSSVHVVRPSMSKIRILVLTSVFATACDGAPPSDAERSFAALEGTQAPYAEFATKTDGRQLDEDGAQAMLSRAEAVTDFAVQPDANALWYASPVEGQFDPAEPISLADTCGGFGGARAEATWTVEELSATGYTKYSYSNVAGIPPASARCEYVGALGWCIDDQEVDFTGAGIDAVVSIESTMLDLWRRSGDFRTYVNTEYSCDGEDCEHPFLDGFVENGFPCARLDRTEWDYVGSL